MRTLPICKLLNQIVGTVVRWLVEIDRAFVQQYLFQDRFNYLLNQPAAYTKECLQNAYKYVTLN